MTEIEAVQTPSSMEVNGGRWATFLHWGLDNAIPNNALQELDTYAADFETVGGRDVTQQAIEAFHKRFEGKLSVDQRNRLLRWYLSDR